MKRVTFKISVIIFLCFISIAKSQSAKNQDSSIIYRQADRYQTGFYLIAAEADSTISLPPANANQRVVRYDYKYLQVSERSKPRYLLLPKTVDVPLMLIKTPELQKKGKNGFPELRLELTSESASKLEKLTRDHIGGKVAFAIDGEPVTLHKIRSIITDGKFRLSRCTDTACQYIYGRLVEKQ
jgi:preprotein translocase subunit SecD